MTDKRLDARTISGLQLDMTARSKRFLVYLALALVALGISRWQRRWEPTHTVETQHYRIQSSAEKHQTDAVARVVEMLYRTYAERLGNSPGYRTEHPKLRLKLYRDRKEFRRCNPDAGWAEAFYREPYCHQYYAKSERNPFHWMIHEATHQLNHEVAGLRLAKWMNEGVAEYFGTSVIGDDVLSLGETDRETYPIWWLRSLGLSGDLDADIAAGKFLPLDAIVQDEEPLDMDEHFNRYYVHWWSLSYFLFHFDGARYADGYVSLLASGDHSIAGFEKHIGPILEVQKQWYGDLVSKVEWFARRRRPGS